MMKNTERGVYEDYSSIVDAVEVRVTKWFNNVPVTLVSTLCSAQPTDIIQCFSKQDEKLNVSRSYIIKQ